MMAVRVAFQEASSNVDSKLNEAALCDEFPVVRHSLVERQDLKTRDC